MTNETPPTITDLIEQLETIRDEHGDLPVVYLEEAWHVFPSPEVVDDEGTEWTPDDNIREKRVEL